METIEMTELTEHQAGLFLRQQEAMDLLRRENTALRSQLAAQKCRVVLLEKRLEFERQARKALAGTAHDLKLTLVRLGMDIDAASAAVRGITG